MLPPSVPSPRVTDKGLERMKRWNDSKSHGDAITSLRLHVVFSVPSLLPKFYASTAILRDSATIRDYENPGIEFKHHDMDCR